MFSAGKHITRRGEQCHKRGEVESVLASIVTTPELLQANRGPYSLPKYTGWAKHVSPLWDCCKIRAQRTIQHRWQGAICNVLSQHIKKCALCMWAGAQ